MAFFFQIFVLVFFLFLIGGWILYNVVLVSAIQHHKSAKSTYMFPLSWTSLTPSYPIGHHRAPCWAPCFIQQLHTSNLFYTWLSPVQSLSCVQLFATPWTAARQASLSITSSWSFPKLMPIELVMLSSHLILCHPLLLPSICPSIRVFSNKSVLHIRWPKYWSFSFNISSPNVYSGLIPFRIDWFDLLAVQGDFYEAEAEDHALQFYLPIVTAFPPCLMRLVSPCLKNQ